MENQAGSSQPTGRKSLKAVALPISLALTLALLFVLSHTSFALAQGDVFTVDTLAGYNLIADSNVGPSAIAPILPPAAPYLSGTGEDPLETKVAPWWVIVVVLTVLVIIGLKTRTKPDR